MRDAENSTSNEKHTSDLDWKVFSCLMFLALAASFAVVPYLLEIMQATADNTSTWELVPAIVFERVFFSGIAICVGLIVCRKLGRAATTMNVLTHGESSSTQRLRSSLLLSMACGLGVSATIYLLDPILEAALVPELPESARLAEEAARQMSPWKPLFASFSAGVTEELWFRFCVMTLFAWAGCRLTHQLQPSTTLVWTANFMAAILFGLLHLTNVVQLGIAITPAIVLYVVVWNGFAGVVFGWLYWQRGLIYAMLAHMVTDIVLKVLIPLVESALA